MDLVVQRANLLKELQYVQGVVERKTTLPILSNLLMETSGNDLIMTATDLDVTLRCSCQAEIKVSGAAALSARKLFDIVRLLPEAEVHFKSSDPDWIHLRCDKAKFKIASLAKENFPEVPKVQGERLTLPASSLRHMINCSVFAVTQEETRYALNGALMLIKSGRLTLVSTDGHRLAMISCNLGSAITGEELKVLIPKKTLVELSRLAVEDLASVEFSSSENHLFFKLGKRLLVSRLLTGQFPNYEMVIPRDNDKRPMLKRQDFVNALKRVSVMADEQSHAIRFSIKEGQLDVSSPSSDVGEAKETLPAEYAGPPLEIGFNAQYLLDFLIGLDSEEVVVELRDGETQGLLKPRSETAYSYQYVVMPMKL